MKLDTKRRILRRLKIIEGQVRGLQKLVERNTYCVDLIRQTSAARKALFGVENLVLENHLETHAREQMSGSGHRRAVRELLTAYKLSHER